MLSIKNKEEESCSMHPAGAVQGACSTCECLPSGRMSSLILTLVGESSPSAKTMIGRYLASDWEVPKASDWEVPSLGLGGTYQGPVTGLPSRTSGS